MVRTLTLIVVFAVGAGLAVLWTQLGRPGRPAEDRPAVALAPEAEAAVLRTGVADAPRRVPTSTTPGEFMPMSLAPVVEAALPAVVNIASTRTVRSRPSPFASDPFFQYFFGRRGLGAPQERREQSLGSGVIISADGYVVTNNHVIQNGQGEVQVYWDDEVYDAEIIGRDAKTDVALLKIDADRKLPFLPFANSDALRAGDFVIAIGNPFGLDRTVTMGIVSAVGRADIGVADYEDFIQTDAAINPGNSGGALLSLSGELIGVNTAILSRSGGYQGIGFAIPSNMADGVVESLIEHGEVRRGWTGLAVQELTRDLAQAMGIDRNGGVLVSDVFEGSPGDRAGLSQGDVIIRVGDRPVGTIGQYRSRTERLLPGMEVDFGIIRGDQEMSVTLAVERVPEEDDAQRFEAFESSVIPGLSLETLTADQAQRLGFSSRARGVLVVDVADGSAAARAGLRPGDVIAQAQRVRVRSLEELESVVSKVTGNQLLLLVQRGSRSYYVALPNRG